MDWRKKSFHIVLCLSWIIFYASVNCQTVFENEKMGENQSHRNFYYQRHKSCSTEELNPPNEGCQFCNLSAVCVSNNDHANIHMSQLPQDIEELTLILTENILGEFVVQHDAINLTRISTFTRLQKFHIKLNPDQMMTLQPQDLVFLDDSFMNLTSLKQLRINVPLHDGTDLMQMTKYLGSIEFLDLSHTVTLGHQAVTNALSVLNKTSLTSLSLSNFQTIGSHGFSHELNISSFFKSREPLNIRHLDLSHNYLGLIHPSISTVFPNLTTLDISYNMLILNVNTAFLIESFLHVQLKTIKCGNQGFRWTNSYESPTDVSQHKPTYNHINFVNGKAFLRLTFNCMNQYVEQNISHIVNNNKMLCEIISCVLNQTILFPCHLFGTFDKAFDLSCGTAVKLPFFNNLKSLNMDNLNWIIPEGFQLSGNLCFESAKIVNVSFRNNEYWCQNEYFAESVKSFTNVIGINELEKVDFSNNKASLRLPINITHTFTMIHTVELPNNNVSFDNKSVCEKWPNIRHFNVHQNGLTDGKLPDMAFHSCSKLEELELSNNFLTLNATSLNLSGNVNLRLLDLSNNRITNLPESMRQYLDDIAKYQLQNGGHIQISVVLSGNPIQCSCSEQDLSFAKWLLQTKVNIHIADQILCIGDKGIQVLNNDTWAQLHKDCSKMDIVIKCVAVTGSFAFVIFMISVVYLFRWKLRYNLFKISEHLKKLCPVESKLNHSGTWTYDVFVSYCADDRFWVHDCLMKTLENKYGFKLCIHYRDFPLGATISSAIIQAIEESKQLIVVVSDKSIRRPWCHFELETALTEVQKRQTKLLVIKLGDFLPPEDIWDVMKKNIYLQWSYHPDAEKLFWKKLISHLYSKGSLV